MSIVRSFDFEFLIYRCKQLLFKVQTLTTEVQELSYDSIQPHESTFSQSICHSPLQHLKPMQKLFFT